MTNDTLNRIESVNRTIAVMIAKTQLTRLNMATDHIFDVQTSGDRIALVQKLRSLIAEAEKALNEVSK